MNNNDVPIWEKYTLTIEEAAKYFRIGKGRWGIKPKQFEKMIDTVDAI